MADDKVAVVVPDDELAAEEEQDVVEEQQVEEEEEEQQQQQEEEDEEEEEETPDAESEASYEFEDAPVAAASPELEAKDSALTRQTSSGVALSRTVTNQSRPGRKIRASITSRLVGNLQRGGQAKSSWVTGILFFDHDPGFDKVQELVTTRLMVMPRFRARLGGRSFPIPQAVHFREIDLEKDFDIDYHVKLALADGPAVTEEEVVQYVETLYDGWVPDLKKPLWQLEYIPRMDDGRAALITKISHAIGDGVSQIEVLLRLLDPPTDEAEAEKQKAMRPPQKRKKKSTFGPLNRARIFMGGVWSGVFNVFSAPDPANTLRPKSTKDVSAQRRFAFTDKIPLARIKEVKNKLEGATVNDVLILLLTLTMRRFFEEVDDKKVLGGSKVSAQFPISTRGRNEGAFRDDDPRNKFSYGFLQFYVREKGSLIDLFWKIKRDLDKIKLSPAPFVTTRTAQALIPILPLPMLNNTVLNAANKATAQLSNVAAPAEAVTLAGAKVTDMSFLIFSPLALYLGILSYAGNVSASICLEANLGVDPKDLAKHWGASFEEIYDEVMSHDDVIPQQRGCLDCL